MKRLLILGASVLQLPAIKKAKEMGYYVGVIDYNPSAVGVSCADEYFNVSTIDEEGVYRVAKDFRADGIITLATDMPMRSLAYACEKLGLVGISYATAIKVTDKAEMIRAFEKYGVHHPKFFVINNTSDIEKISSKMFYPCITKPTDNSGSRGVTVAYNIKELKEAVVYSSANARNGRVIIEELMKGYEVSVEVIIYNNIPTIIQITDKLTTGEPHFVEIGHSQPSSLPTDILQKIELLTYRAIQAVGIENGAAHVEIMITDQGPKLIELGARLGGDCITTHLVPLSTGVDMVKAIIDISLGDTPDLDIKFSKGSAIRFITASCGKIKEIIGIDTALKKPNIANIEVIKKSGDIINTLQSSMDRIGYVISNSYDVRSAIFACERALTNIEVVLEKKPKILFLGGFSQMVDILKTAKEIGIYSIVVDRDPASPAKKIADKSFDISTDKVDDLVQLCKDEKINGIFNGFEDFNIHIASEICNRLNLPFYATKEQLDLVTNKDKFKEKCREYDIDIIEQYSFAEAMMEDKYPYIVKPADSYGSRGITICHNEVELAEGYYKALNSSVKKKVIIEKFIDSDCGTEVFYTIVDGNIYMTATADRYTIRIGDNNVPLPIAEVFPSKYRSEIVEKVDGNLRKIISSLSIRNGLVLIQMINQKGTFYPYEMAFRLTGEQHYQIVKARTGVDLSRMMIKLCLGEDISEYDNNIEEIEIGSYGINLSILLTAGRIEKITGLECLNSINEILGFIIMHTEKDIVKDRVDYGRILLRINMVAKNNDELVTLVKKILASIAVISDSGEDMLIREFCILDCKMKCDS